jgi:hypothetical protein
MDDFVLQSVSAYLLDLVEVVVTDNPTDLCSPSSCYTRSNRCPTLIRPALYQTRRLSTSLPTRSCTTNRSNIVPREPRLAPALRD